MSGRMRCRVRVDVEQFHPNVICDICNEKLGSAARYMCLDCADYDLCCFCERTESEQHFGGDHVFAKIKDSRNVDVSKYRARVLHETSRPTFVEAPVSPPPDRFYLD
eukprot:TRINITY_DN13649_c0_g1_i1.p1 TRINITY_DN13649_c0_g1~~TRINITY_DN13649_c0_g1_i1.p1  ORF type:complete len:107 (-),score=17.33 TRINITY_DN13649_c0_g1_i1:51-371(-)